MLFLLLPNATPPHAVGLEGEEASIRVLFSFSSSLLSAGQKGRKHAHFGSTVCRKLLERAGEASRDKAAGSHLLHILHINLFFCFSVAYHISRIR